jgi:zinc/manganese transport system substrate-binding protein/manganese/iron transport system substrate-binding protein
MRLRITCSAVAALLLVAALSCTTTGTGQEDGERLKVLAITTQIGDFAREVGAEQIQLSVLLKPNQEAHDFEPSPSQVRALKGASLVLRNGLGLDAFLDKALAGSAARVVTVTSGVQTRSLEGEPDPHVWLDVANAAVMVGAVRDAFVAADRANAESYRRNAAAYLRKLEQLDAQIRAEVATLPARCRKLVTNHEVLGYYAGAYGFELLGSVIAGISSEARASARDLARTIDLVRTENVPAIFAEAGVNPGLVRQVGREAGVKVVDDLYGDSLGPRGSEGATYIGMMQANTGKIVAALSPCAAWDASRDR